ncbi:MAG TPA: lipopolysaccharide kinase InaA family protein [Candidatus Paceibacterota bacterium]|nr:lipopolysaccharide kinase InaA family protein [Verrucomicrobiota bacterium]HSA09915.1 lipopolysaccharide kinase InaA family protein [Candidatus Paceibacterota bacterium]
MNPNRRLTPQAQNMSGASVLRQRVGSFDWLIAAQSDSQPLLADLIDPAWLLRPPAEPLKRVVVSGREVVRVRGTEPGGGDLVVKHFSPRGLTEMIKWGWRGSPAYRAFHLAWQLQVLGIGTATPVAAGERRCCGWLRESYLITRHISGATPLYETNAHCTDRRRRSHIVRQLALAYATMHDAGFCHCDPSQTNFLTVRQARDQEELLLIDLDGLRRRGQVALAEAGKDLRRLLLRCQVPRRERVLFLAVYARSRKESMNARQLLQCIGPLPAQFSFPFCALNEEGLPKAAPSLPAQVVLKERPPMQLRRTGRLQWVVRSSHFTLQVETILNAPDRFLEQARVLKPSRSSAVSARDGLVLKRYNFRKWGNPFLDLLRGSTARRAFQKALRLELAGLPTARAVATADERRFFLPRRSYLLMEEIPGAVPLQSWGGSKPQAAKALGELLGGMHGAGFTHRDLKPGNILFNGEGRPYLIDLDGLRFVRRVSDSRAAADLGRLARDLQHWHRRPSRTDRARFLIAYCRARRLPDWRWWWRTIEKRLPR